jgi:DNA-binding transcriptional LysR family regulator
MLEYSELKTFTAVAKHLNFAKAASEIGLSAPQISKIIAGLEIKMKCKLLHRTTRNVRLTTEGQTFLEVTIRALETLYEANQLFEANVKPESMTGKVRVTAPNTLGTRFLAGPLRAFTQMYPKLQVEVLLDDQYLDFIENDVDVALRVMKPQDSSLIARLISKNPVGFYSSPNFIERQGAPKSVPDLAQYPVFSIPQHLPLKFAKAKLKLESAVSKSMVVCGNGDLLVDIVVQGYGIVVRSEWGVEKEVNDGKLVKININDHLISDTQIYLVYQKHKYTASRVKAFVDVFMNNINLFPNSR